MVDYMEDQGFPGTQQTETYGITPGVGRESDDGQIGTQEVRNPDGEGVRGTLSGFYSYSEEKYWITFQVDLLFELSLGSRCAQSAVSWGEDPKDVLNLGWNERHTKYWDIEDDTQSDFKVINAYKDYTEFNDDWYSADTIAYQIDDNQAFRDWADEHYCESIEEYVPVASAGVKLIPANNHSPSDREIYGRYEHSWETTTTNLGMSFGWSLAGPMAGIQLDPQSEVESEATVTEEDGYTTLKISQADIN